MFITDEPGGWRRDSLSVAVSVLAAMALLGGSLTLAIEASPQDDPPTGARAGYIQNLESPSRQEWQKPDQVVERLKLEGGQRVAEIGSGSGYFVVRFARAVGESGKVYAVDIDPDMLNYLRWRAGHEDLRNIELVRATPDDPKLAGSSVDLVFLCNTIHHIENRDRYYPFITRALREGGRLVIVDFYDRPLPVPSPRVKIARSDMIKDIEQAGFHLVEEYDFLPHQYFLVFELNSSVSDAMCGDVSCNRAGFFNQGTASFCLPRACIGGRTSLQEHRHAPSTRSTPIQAGNSERDSLKTR